MKRRAVPCDGGLDRHVGVGYAGHVSSPLTTRGRGPGRLQAPRARSIFAAGTPGRRAPAWNAGGGRGGRWAAWSGPMSARCQATQAGDSQPGCPGRGGEGTPVPGTPGRSDRAARLPPQRGSAGRPGWPPPFARMAHQAGTTPADCELEHDATATDCGLWVATTPSRGGTVNRGRSLFVGTPTRPGLRFGAGGLS